MTSKMWGGLSSGSVGVESFTFFLTQTPLSLQRHVTHLSWRATTVFRGGGIQGVALGGFRWRGSTQEGQIITPTYQGGTDQPGWGGTRTPPKKIFVFSRFFSESAMLRNKCVASKVPKIAFWIVWGGAENFGLAQSVGQNVGQFSHATL